MGESGQVLKRFDGIEPRAFTFLETNGLPESIRHDEDIGKQDCSVEAETADRLQRHLGGELRRIAQVEKAPGFSSDFSVFRQIATSLAHQPDRWWRDGFARKRQQETL